MKGLFLLLAAGALLFPPGAWAQVSKIPPKPAGEFRPGAPVAQPLPFSHRAHSAVGLKCAECHSIPEPGDFATFPTEKKCMACHIAVKKESPHIARLAAAAKSGQAIEWARVYKLKDFVYFSHEVHHRKAGVECGKCHGEVASRDVLFAEKPIDMYACMSCHSQYKAPNTCETCHDTH